MPLQRPTRADTPRKIRQILADYPARHIADSVHNDLRHIFPRPILTQLYHLRISKNKRCDFYDVFLFIITNYLPLVHKNCQSHVKNQTKVLVTLRYNFCLQLWQDELDKRMWFRNSIPIDIVSDLISDVLSDRFIPRGSWQKGVLKAVNLLVKISTWTSQDVRSVPPSRPAKPTTEIGEVLADNPRRLPHHPHPDGVCSLLKRKLEIKPCNQLFCCFYSLRIVFHFFQFIFSAAI